VADGRGSLDWNGNLDTSPGDDFPDGFATLAGSPYRVRLSAKDGDKELSREAQIRVEVVEVKLEVAPSCLTNVGYQEVAKRLQPLGITQTVPLRVSSFIKLDTQAKDLGPGEDIGHQEATKVWEGLSIPLVATVLVQSSRKNHVVAGKALGRARILWDYIEPPPASRPGISDDNNQYLHAIETYDQEHAGPPNGRNTPVVLGGKRSGKETSSPVLGGPGKGIVDFPFALEPGKDRFWAAFSELQKAGDREGQAGIVFRPSVISGDAYKIMAYVDMHGTLDSLDPIPDEIPRGDAGWLEIRREVPVVRFVRKCPEVSVKLNDISSFTDPAYLGCLHEISDKDEVLGKAAYTALLQDALGKIRRPNGRLFEDFAMLPIEEQYDAEASWWDRLWGDPERIASRVMVSFRKYDKFIDACDEAVKRPSHAGLVEEGKRWKRAGGKETYSALIHDRAATMATHMGQALAVQAGVTVVGFDGLHNLGPITIGKAVPQKQDRWRITIMIFDNGADTLAHELGHCLFLPHAPSSRGIKIAGVKASRHVRGHDRCLMSYGNNRPGFCAVCLLRLRGANGNKLGPMGIVP
jgi:hypothetical protein